MLMEKHINIPLYKKNLDQFLGKSVNWNFLKPWAKPLGLLSSKGNCQNPWSMGAIYCAPHKANA